MIIKKKQLLIDAPCIIGKKERQSNDSNNAFDPATVARIWKKLRLRPTKFFARLKPKQPSC